MVKKKSLYMKIIYVYVYIFIYVSIYIFLLKTAAKDYEMDNKYQFLLHI